jgi:hypothetical protein
MYLHSLDLSSSSLFMALGRSRLVHADEEALVARLASSTLPVATALSSPATANIAEVNTARLASHVVAATSMLDSALTAGAHLPVDGSGEMAASEAATLLAASATVQSFTWYLMFSGVL